MRPLAPVVREYRIMGGAFLAAGVLVVVAASQFDDPLRVIARTTFTTVLFGGLYYVSMFRSTVRRALEHVGDPPTPEREPPRTTAARIGTPVIVAAVVIGAAGLLLEMAYLGAGVLLGNGAAALLAGRVAERWERRHGRTLLGEPRFFRASGGSYAEP